MIISTTGECALKKNSATFVFPQCDINQFNQSMEISFFSCVFFHNHSRITGLQGKGEGISLTPQYHFHPLHRYLDISRAITAESSPLHRGGSNRTGSSFSIHGSGETFPLINDVIICKYISYKCLRKGAVVLYRYIM